MIGHLAHRRMSLVARVDRIVSTVLVIAFVATGFQTGYRLARARESFFASDQWSVAGDQSSVGQIAVETPVPVREPLPMWQGTDRLNILVMGLDQRPGSALPGRADVIMIASVDPVQRKVALISIPRDLWVEIPGHGENRINSAYFYGEFHGTQGGGPGLMKRTIEQNLGVRVDHYGTLDFGCFTQVIDILGGITIDVPEPIRDDRYPDKHYGYMSIYIPAGRQNMDGETALQYVRARHQSSDFSRMRRQQQVIMAVRNKALRLDIILSLPDLIPLLGKAFATDLALDDVLGLANLAAQIELEDIELRVVGQSLTVPYTAPDGAQVLVPRIDRIQAMMGEVMREVAAPSEAPEPEVGEARILVRADVTRPGLDAEVADFLQRRGYDAQLQSTGIQIQSQGTFIASRRDMAGTAVLISGLLGVDPELVILSPNVEEGTDIVVTVGRDFVMP